MAKTKAKLRFPNRKISDTFLQFAEPLLEALGPDLSEAQMEQPLMIAWTVWNAVVYADVAKNNRSLDMVRSSMDQAPESKILVEALIERKRALFADDYRLIGEYKLFHKDGEVRLRAEARDPRTRS
jgi:hypothetical protein